MDNKIKLFIGSYTSPENDGLYYYIIDENSLEIFKIASIDGVSNPSYITSKSDVKKIYSVMETMEHDSMSGGAVVSYDIKDNKIIKNSVIGTKGTLPCHVLLDEDRGYIFTSNYMDGSLSMFKLDFEGNIDRICSFKKHVGNGPNKERQDGPHAHYAGFDENKEGIWCVDLGLDTLIYYKIDSYNDELISNYENNIELPKGVGPRHFVLGKKELKLMYVVCELSSEVIAFNYYDNSILQKISTLDENVKNNFCSGIKISNDINYLYVANRGDDSITVFKIRKNGLLDKIQIIKSGGKNPRDFEITDQLMIIANQDSDNVKIYKIDRITGKLTSTNKSIEIKSAACIHIVK